MSAEKRLLICLLLATPLNALALTSDRDQPIQIQADRVELDEKRRISTYLGDVRLQQGSMRLNAEKLVVRRSEEVDRITAEGKPVTFAQRPDGADYDIRGQAHKIDYRADQAILELQGEAHLWQGKDEFSGQRIVFELNENRVRASSGGDTRVQAVIHPRRNGEKQ